MGDIWPTKTCSNQVFVYFFARWDFCAPQGSNGRCVSPAIDHKNATSKAPLSTSLNHDILPIKELTTLFFNALCLMTRDTHIIFV